MLIKYGILYSQIILNSKQNSYFSIVTSKLSILHSYVITYGLYEPLHIGIPNASTPQSLHSGAGLLTRDALLSLATQDNISLQSLDKYSPYPI